MDVFIITSAISIVTVTLNLILGLLILSKRPYKSDQLVFFIFIILTSTWILTSTFSNYPFGLAIQSLLLKLDFFLAPYAVYSYLVFTQIFGDAKLLLHKNALGVLGVFTVICSFIAAFTDLIIKNTYSIHAGIGMTPGPLDIPFALFIALILSLSVVTLIVKARRMAGYEKLQISYLAIGSIATAVIITITNILLWRFLNIDSSTSYLVVLVIPSIGRSSIIFASISAAYAIVRHRLFGIRVILGEILFWLTGSALVFLFFYSTILIEQQFFDSLTNPLVISLNILIALIVFPTLRATNNWLRHAIRKITINVSFDREHILTEYNKEITQSHTTKDIIDSLFSLIHEAYVPKFAGIVLIEQKTSNVTAEWRSLDTEQLMIAQSEEAITQFFNENTAQVQSILPGVDLQLPFELSEYQGALVLGERKDTAAYASEDVRFLNQILSYTALNLARTTR